MKLKQTMKNIFMNKTILVIHKILNKNSAKKNI